MRNLPSFATILLGALPLLGATSASAANADSGSGRTAYANSCASCHGVPSSPWGVSVQSLQSAIQGNRGGMGRLSSLSAVELQDIAAYLANPSATAVATNNSTPTTLAAIPTATPSATPTPTNNDSDRLFDWAESTNPQLFNSHSVSENLDGYYLRYYPGTGVYLASQNGQLYFYNSRRPKEGVLPLGPLSGWLNQLTPATNTPARPGDNDNGREGGENHNGRDDNDHGHDSRDRD